VISAQLPWEKMDTGIVRVVKAWGWWVAATLRARVRAKPSGLRGLTLRLEVGRGSTE
jgi:hypothetical protein